MKQLIELEQLVQNSKTVNSLWEAHEIIGNTNGNGHVGFSIATKMPCWTYSTPAVMCKTGTILRSVKGSICSDCFACSSEGTNKHVGGWYETDRVQQPMTHRLLQILFNPRWTDAMIYLFRYYRWPIFRWHDSGDIQNDEHFENLCKIADAIPETLFWLPTQEWQIVINYWHKKGRIPLKILHPNLIVRLSARLKDGQPPLWLARMIGVQVSRVSTKGIDVDCPAGQQGNQCGPCRKCWNQDVECITYHYHDGHDHYLESPFMINVKNSVEELLAQGVSKTEIYNRVSEQYSIQKISVRIVAMKLRKELNKKLVVLQGN